jgi:hypothetical protein
MDNSLVLHPETLLNFLHHLQCTYSLLLPLHHSPVALAPLTCIPPPPNPPMVTHSPTASESSPPFWWWRSST